MELIKYNKNIYVTYQRQGNDKNGNPLYIINVFKRYDSTGNDDIKKENAYVNMNYTLLNDKYISRLDKYSNIKCQTYNIEDTIIRLCKLI